MGRALTGQQRLSILDTAASMPDASTSAIGRALGLPRKTVADTLTRLAPVIDELRQPKRDAILAAWQTVYFDTYEDMLSRRNDGDLAPRDRQALATTMGIATDKIQLVAGLPTQIVAGVHQVRTNMPDVVDRLVGLSRRLRVDGKRIDSAPLPAHDISMSRREPGDEGTEAIIIPDREGSK